MSALDTDTQRMADEQAMRILASAPVLAAREEAVHHYRADPNAGIGNQDELIERSIAEQFFHATLMAVAEALPPAFVLTIAPPHDLGGVVVPGSRWGHDNPDNCHRLAVIDADCRYEIHGRLGRAPSTDFSISIMAGQPGENMLGGSTAVITRDRLDIDGEGRFVITLDGEETAGRRNHLCIRGGRVVFVRDALADWASEMPAELELRPVGRHPARTFDFDAAAARAAQLGSTLVRFVLQTLQHGIIGRVPVNTMSPPWSAGDNGGLVGQSSSMGHYRLGSDEALLITVDPQGAKYVGMQVCDLWMISCEARGGSGSLNHRQAEQDADGRYRYVISACDPGVPNWLDAEGRSCGTILLRWQGLDAATLPGEASRIVQRIPLDRLREHLPAGTRTVSPAERTEANTRRLAAWRRRFG